MLSSIAILPVFRLARSSWTKKKVRFQGNQLQTKWSGPKTPCETPGCWPSGSYCSHLLWPGTGMPPPLVHCSLFLFCYNYRREGAGNLPPPPHPPPSPWKAPARESIWVCYSPMEMALQAFVFLAIKSSVEKKALILVSLSHGPVFINWEFWWKIFNQT